MSIHFCKKYIQIYRVTRYINYTICTKGSVIMPRTEAQKRADKKYIAKTYKRIAVNIRLEYMEAIARAETE